MDTLLRFFKPYDCDVFEQYKMPNIPIPRVDDIVWLSDDEPYRVQCVTYGYNASNVILVDVELRDVEEEYWDNYTLDFDDIEDDECECDGCCEACELNAEAEEEEEIDLPDIVGNVKALFRDLGFDVKFKITAIEED